MKFKLLLFTLFIVLISVSAKANTIPDNGEEDTRKSDVIGGVYHHETKKPLSSVSVTAYNLSSKKEKVVLTDANGNYSFDDLQSGTYKFVFIKQGYKKVVKEKVTIRLDEGSEMNVEMDEHASFNFMPGPFHFTDF